MKRVKLNEIYKYDFNKRGLDHDLDNTSVRKYNVKVGQGKPLEKRKMVKYMYVGACSCACRKKKLGFREIK